MSRGDYGEPKYGGGRFLGEDLPGVPKMAASRVPGEDLPGAPRWPPSAAINTQAIKLSLTHPSNLMCCRCAVTRLCDDWATSCVWVCFYIPSGMGFEAADHRTHGEQSWSWRGLGAEGVVELGGAEAGRRQRISTELSASLSTTLLSAHENELLCPLHHPGCLVECCGTQP